MLLTVMQCVNVLLCIHVLVQLVAKAETFEPLQPVGLGAPTSDLEHCKSSKKVALIFFI